MAPRSDLDTLPDERQDARRAHEALLSRSLEGTVLSAVRVVIAFFYLCHGAQKLFGVVGGVDGHGAVAATGAWPGWWAGLIELVAGALILVGLFSRPAAILCSGEMAFAYFTVHQPHAALPVQNHGELAAMFSWSFLLIAALGPGWLSLDALVRTARQRR
ncbi:MAG TPA: DoxX family protein [Pseudonocardia sp.]|nr:DoxX family protein [Pseudonocardia sp.]